MDVRERVAESIDRDRDALVALSHAIHADAETAFEEHASSARVAGMLADADFEVMHGGFNLPTSVLARIGTGPLNIALCAEYDALPGIGHACGHNIIAAAAVGAARALAPLADELGLTVTVLGTPGEEGGGGKIYLLERGAFDGIHAAMMIHPAPMDAPTMPCLAVQQLEVHYAGRAAHAAAFPEHGINAADAVTIAQVGIGLLRQHLRPSDRVHGIVTDGGDAPNIVPAHAGGTWYVRASNLEALGDVVPRVQQCFEAGAIATGAALTISEPAPPYAELPADDELCALYVREAEQLGRAFPTEIPPLAGSTDMGNVARVIPAIHPLIGIDTQGAVNHQPEFAEACIAQSADQAIMDGALALARTCVGITRDSNLTKRLLAQTFRAASAGD